MRVKHRGWLVIYFVREYSGEEWTILRRPYSTKSEWRRRGYWIEEGKAWVDQIEGPTKERVRTKTAKAKAKEDPWAGVPKSVQKACDFFSIWAPPVSQAAVKKKWKAVAKYHHPDLVGGDGKVMKQANAMYDLIVEWLNR